PDVTVLHRDAQLLGQPGVGLFSLHGSMISPDLVEGTVCRVACSPQLCVGQRAEGRGGVLVAPHVGVTPGTAPPELLLVQVGAVRINDVAAYEFGLLAAIRANGSNL